MLVAKELLKTEGVSVASLSMGTEANYKIMGSGGFDLGGVDATPNDLIIAVKTDAPEGERAALLEGALKKRRNTSPIPPGEKRIQGATTVPRALTERSRSSPTRTSP
jgi:FdrA protein